MKKELAILLALVIIILSIGVFSDNLLIDNSIASLAIAEQAVVELSEYETFEFNTGRNTYSLSVYDVAKDRNSVNIKFDSDTNSELSLPVYFKLDLTSKKTVTMFRDPVPYMIDVGKSTTLSLGKEGMLDVELLRIHNRAAYLIIKRI